MVEVSGVTAHGKSPAAPWAISSGRILRFLVRQLPRTRIQAWAGRCATQLQARPAQTDSRPCDGSAPPVSTVSWTAVRSWRGYSCPALGRGCPVAAAPCSTLPYVRRAGHAHQQDCRRQISAPSKPCISSRTVPSSLCIKRAATLFDSTLADCETEGSDRPPVTPPVVV